MVVSSNLVFGSTHNFTCAPIIWHIFLRLRFEIDVKVTPINSSLRLAFNIYYFDLFKMSYYWLYLSFKSEIFCTIANATFSRMLFYYLGFTYQRGFSPRSCKRSNTLFQESLLLFSTWRENFCSQPTIFSSHPKK